MFLNNSTIKIVGIATTLVGLLLDASVSAITPRCANSSQIPLTAAALRTLAAKRGVITYKQLDKFSNNPNKGVVINVNNSVGYSFERFAKETLNTPPKSSIITPLGEIVPDAVGTEIVKFRDKDKNIVGRCEYNESVFTDIKAVGGTLNLDSNNRQLEKFILALAKSPAAIGTPSLCVGKTNPNVLPVPRLIFVTVRDTKIDQLLIERATSEGISIGQQIVCQDPNNSDWIQIGPGVVQNLEVYRRQPPHGKRFVDPKRIKAGTSGLLSPKQK